MAERMIKFRAFHYYREVPAPGMVGGPMMLAEQQAYFGETVDIEREEDLERGETLGAFYSEKEIKQIKAGTYRGPDWEQLAAGPMVAAFTPEEEARRQILAPAGSEGEASAGGPAIDVEKASDEEIAEYIEQNNLNVPETIALASGRKDLAEKVLDAEMLASNNDPRKGVLSALEKTMTEGEEPGGGGG